MGTEDENKPSALTHQQPSTTEGCPHFSMEQHITESESHLEKVMPEFATLGKINLCIFLFFGTHTSIGTLFQPMFTR